MQTDAKTWNYCELICIKFKFLTRICISNNRNYIQRKTIPQCWKRRKILAPRSPQLHYSIIAILQKCRQMSDCLQVICNLANYFRLLQICKWQLQLNPDCLLRVCFLLILEFCSFIISGWGFIPLKEQKHILVRSPLSRIKYLKNWFQQYWLF